MEIFTKSTEETRKAGREFSTYLIGGEVIALTGGLGSGKTTFIQGLAGGLGVSERIISPTFIILREYPFGEKHFYHVDLYRLEDIDRRELENLGLTEIWTKEKNIVAIEWAEKARGALPKSTIEINFKSIGENERKIIIKR